MKKKKTIGGGVSYSKWGYLFIAPFFVVYTIFQLVPQALTIYNSFFENYREGLTQIGPRFVGLQNYVKLFTPDKNGTIDILKYFVNTIVLWVGGAIPQILIALLLALFFTSYRLKIKGQSFFKAVMVIPKQVSATGFVQLCYKFHLTNSYLPLILPGIAAPVVFFYMKQYMESVLPMEIVDAARVDGSGEFYTFNFIILPMIKPALAVQMIFSFVESWNNYFLPALLLDKAEMKTVPIMIAQLRSADYSKFDLGKVYMFILLAILPVMLVYIILSKSIIRGVTAGSVKG